MRTLILSTLVGVVLVMAWGCGDSVTDCISTRTCSYSEEGGTSTDGSADGDSGVVVPPGCDLTKDPKDAPACIDNGVGIFVAPTGSDNSSGSKELPVKTIGKGVELAASRGLPRVYVCEGTYDAAVEIKSAVSLHGGMTCAWTYTGVKPKIAPATGIALRVTKVTSPILIQDVEVLGSADVNKPGDSAIAAFVSESMSVTFRSATLIAGAAAPGAKGAARSNYSGASATKGANFNGANGGDTPPCTCVDGTSSTGGHGGNANGSGLTDGASNPPVGTGNSGASKASSCDPGLVGANGLAGAAGQPLAKPGALNAGGWSSELASVVAPNGKPAQGGGGGGTKLDSSSPGGGGGCGGCGGAGGSAGTAGGSSFAVLSFNSSVSIEAGALTTGAAGSGGDGGQGEDGQAGGGPGVGSACNGGSGGNGAGGSGGGGGAGGHSVPVGFVGTEPRVMGAMLTPGTKGPGGAGGAAGAGPGTAGAAGTAGPEGKAQNTLLL